MTAKTETYKAGLAPVEENPGGLRVTSETVTTIIVEGEDGHEMMRGVVGETDGIMAVKTVTHALRFSIAQMDGFEALVAEWRKIRARG
jgi:hypothetical protein